MSQRVAAIVVIVVVAATAAGGAIWAVLVVGFVPWATTLPIC
jgi:hypothetical protein